MHVVHFNDLNNMIFSGGTYYYFLNVSVPTTFSSTDRQARIKFILHDFSDKVQFNGTGSINNIIN